MIHKCKLCPKELSLIYVDFRKEKGKEIICQKCLRKRK